MEIHKKLREYFENKGISNREISKNIGYSEVMVSRYLKSNKPNYDFLKALKTTYTDLDLNNLFLEENKTLILLEDDDYYGRGETLIEKIEADLNKLKKVFSQLNQH